MKIKLITMAVVALLAVSLTQTANATEGNVTTCAQVGFTSSLQYKGDTKSSVDVTDAFTATVTSDKFVTITNIDPGISIQAIVLKGGNNYKVYPTPTTNMQSPLNGGGNIPDLSHWFVCYTGSPTTTVPTETTSNETITTQSTVQSTTTQPVQTTTTSTVDTVQTTTTIFIPPSKLPATGNDTLWFLFIGTLLLGFGMLILRRS